MFLLALLLSMDVFFLLKSSLPAWLIGLNVLIFVLLALPKRSASMPRLSGLGEPPPGGIY